MKSCPTIRDYPIMCASDYLKMNKPFVFFAVWGKMSGAGGGKRPMGGDSPPGPPEKKSKKEEKTTTTLIEPIRIAGVSSTVSFPLFTMSTTPV